ncbi:MAG: iron chelate uptake ABC transporter family permease subunit [Thermoleophilia bacterium]|nr:iron chelate uptake ABC transporter family permease subunit [Thermoleophilia bacterium]
MGESPVTDGGGAGQRSAHQTRRRRYRLLMAGLSLSLAGALLLAAVVGAAGLSPGEAIKATLALIAPSWVSPDSYPSWAPGLLRDLRLPRMILAVVTGTALSTAGATFQGVFRNPLAEPYLLGVSAGAAVGATISILWQPLAVLGIYGLPAAAFLGAVLAAFLVYRLATFGGETSPASLLLSGVAVGSTFTAVLSLLMVVTQYDLRTVIVWLMGGLTTASWSKLLLAGPVVAVGLVLMLLHADRLNLMLMGEARAEQLGVDARVTRRNMLVVASLTTAGAVAFSGLIGFVGLMVPHMVRLILGPDHRVLLPASALFGAVFLLLADTAARTLFAPAEIPVGIITAFVGGPFFLYLLRLRKGA